MIQDPKSLVQRVVAHIPVPEGGEAVTKFLNHFKERNGGELPASLRGGRVVLLGDPMPPPDACLEGMYLDGLRVLGEHPGLHWEWCCVPSAIPSIAKCCAQFPEMVFVLNHLGII